MIQKGEKLRLRTADVPEEKEGEDKKQSKRVWQNKIKIKNKKWKQSKQR